MRALRLAASLAPLLVRGASARSKKSVLTSALSVVLVVIGAILISVAGFIRIDALFGADIAYLALGLTYLVAAALLRLPRRKTQTRRLTEGEHVNDPLAQHLPETVLKDPKIPSLVEKIKSNPVAMTAGATAIGFVLSEQILGDKRS
jgi:uncharacterized membrane protein YuzA (DUF378 family)